MALKQAMYLIVEGDKMKRHASKTASTGLLASPASGTLSVTVSELQVKGTLSVSVPTARLIE
jgi:hypothetical protein